LTDTVLFLIVPRHIGMASIKHLPNTS